MCPFDQLFVYTRTNNLMKKTNMVKKGDDTSKPTRFFLSSSNTVEDNFLVCPVCGLSSFGMFGFVLVREIREKHKVLMHRWKFQQQKIASFYIAATRIASMKIAATKIASIEIAAIKIASIYIAVACNIECEANSIFPFIQSPDNS